MVVTVDELSKGLRRILAAAERTGEEVVIVRDERTVARLQPETWGMTAREFFGDLPGVLTAEEGEAWLRDARELGRASDQSAMKS